MIKLNRQILMTTCLVFLLPYISTAAENEHERYVPKEILAKAKIKLEEQARAIAGHVDNVVEHNSSPAPNVARAVRMVGPIFDFEKAAGIKQKPISLDAHASENHSVKSEVMNSVRNTSGMQKSSFEKTSNDAHSEVLNDPRSGLGKGDVIVDRSIDISEDEFHKNLEMLVEGVSEKGEHTDTDMHARKDKSTKEGAHEKQGDPVGGIEEYANKAHDANEVANENSSGHFEEQPEFSQTLDLFKSVLDEQREKAMHSKDSRQAKAGHVDKIDEVHGDGGQADAEHADVKDEHSETNEGDGDTHAKPDFVFEIVEVPTELNQPTREIRALQQLQDRLVAGVPNAFDQYRSRLIKIGKLLRSVDAETWQYKKNLDAVALFTLIGGDPRVGKIARSKTDLSKGHTLYLDAALAYSSGRLSKAFSLFKKIDFKHVPISTAVQFAIVKSMLFGRTDAILAKEYLNFAREFAPGTLAEEAALRRLIRMSSDDKDVKLFTRISRIYISRYKNSFYFNDFLKNYAYSLVRMPKISEGKILDSLKNIFNSLKDNQKLALSSYISGIATEIGMFQLSAWTAKSALSLSRKNGKLHTRMKLYHLASTVTEIGAVNNMTDLIEGINDDVLNAKDKRLYESVIALSHRIYNAPMTQDQIRNEIKLEARNYSKIDPTEELFKDSIEFARKNATIMKSVDILAKSDEVLKEGVL